LLSREKNGVPLVEFYLVGTVVGDAICEKTPEGLTQVRRYKAELRRLKRGGTKALLEALRGGGDRGECTKTKGEN